MLPALGKEPVMTIISQPPAGAAVLPSTQGDRESLDNWLNEGGRLSTSAGAGMKDLPALPSEADALRDMGALFISDFASGRVGQHHNTFQHRSRILRQLKAKLRVTSQGEVCP